MDVIGYLLDGDPAIAWQVMRDLTDAEPDEIAAVRARVATEGWGAQLLDAQADDGLWDGGVYRPGWVDEDRPFYDAWSATHPTLEMLRIYGVDPASPAVSRAVARVRDNVRWSNAGEPYFEGEVEPCINGGALANAAYFGQDGSKIVETLLKTRLSDGGWNCWDEDGTSPSSFHSTLCALEGLWAWESATAEGADALAQARHAGEEYLLARRLMFRASDGGPVDPRFLLTSFPSRWYYDVLRALDYFRLARPERDPRCADAVELVRGKMLPFGLWKLENTHQGSTLFEMEAEHEGFPSRWITLRALRVLRWWDNPNSLPPAG
ncbi:hypothetical protein [uncultured Microbacterium sp.]|uniref:hypothetical protein n=1 Tax=uncultured Microbacterium sp. TaxID=191216 RepID=UPI0035CC89CA